MRHRRHPSDGPEDRRIQPSPADGRVDARCAATGACRASSSAAAMHVSSARMSRRALAAALADPRLRRWSIAIPAAARESWSTGCSATVGPRVTRVQTKSHNAVAAAVSQGRADWGVAIDTVAHAYRPQLHSAAGGAVRLRHSQGARRAWRRPSVPRRAERPFRARAAGCARLRRLALITLRSPPSRVQMTRVKAQVLLDERRDEEVAVVVAFRMPQFERDAACSHASRSSSGLSWLSRNGSLVPWSTRSGGSAPAAIFDQRRRVVFAPAARDRRRDIRSSAFSPQGHRIGDAIGANADTDL